jgi:glycosyltransferase involved in cell wall biosynthesis
LSRAGPTWFLHPGDLDTPTGGYRYDRRIIEHLDRAGRAVRVRRLDDSFPHPTAAGLQDADRCLAGIPDESLVVVDGLAFALMREIAAVHGRRLSLIALVHHPLALETGLPPQRAAALRASEADALCWARRVIVTSPETAALLARDYRVAHNRLRVVEPGTDTALLSAGSGHSALNLLCVASLTPRKGHEILLRALAPLRDRPWHLSCAGSLERSPGNAAALLDLSHRLGLAARVTFTGAVDEPRLAQLYHRADLFVLPTRFEGYGMVLTEALARGLPIVSTRTGPIPRLVPREAGILVEPGDPAALRLALASVMDDAGLRRRLSAGARSARRRLRSWETAGTDFLRVLDEMRHE